MTRNVARWYVYRLLTPDMEVFYIGKGTGKRIDSHEKEAAKGVSSHKCNKIRSLPFIIKEYVAFFWDEQCAYDFETDLIQQVGLQNLTNVMPGGQKAFDRRVIKRITKPSLPISAPPEWSSSVAMGCIRQRPDLFAWFLVNTEGGKRKVSVTVEAPYLSKVLGGAYNYFANNLAPMVFSKALEDKKNAAKVAEMVRPYGVNLEVNYVSA